MPLSIHEVHDIVFQSHPWRRYQYLPFLSKFRLEKDRGGTKRVAPKAHVRHDRSLRQQKEKEERDLDGCRVHGA